MDTRCRRFWEAVVIHFPFFVCSDISVYVQRVEERSFLGSWCSQQNFQALITYKVRALDKFPQPMHFKIVLEDSCSLSLVSMLRKVVECEGKEAHPSTAHGGVLRTRTLRPKLLPCCHF